MPEHATYCSVCRIPAGAARITTQAVASGLEKLVCVLLARGLSVAFRRRPPAASDSANLLSQHTCDGGAGVAWREPEGGWQVGLTNVDGEEIFLHLTLVISIVNHDAFDVYNWTCTLCLCRSN